MRIGIIGLGSMGERHALNVQEMYPHAQIDILTKRRVWKHADKRTNLCISAKIFFALPHDAFIIANETHLHTRTVRRCLSAKPRGIFVEKPLAHTVRDAVRIATDLHKRRMVFMIGYSLQFFQPLLLLRRLIRAGAIGTVLSMRVSVGKDVRRWRTLNYRTRYSSDTKRGGGTILDYIHELNYPAWILGEELYFMCGLLGKMHLQKIHAEDFAESIFVSRTGVVVSVHQDYLQVPGKRYCEVIGTKGTATFSRMLRRGSTENEIRVDTQRKSRVIKIRADGNDMFRRELKFFMDCVRSGKQYSNAQEAVVDVRNAQLIKSRGKRMRKGRA